jgi:small subunit ribosomal protein S9
MDGMIFMAAAKKSRPKEEKPKEETKEAVKEEAPKEVAKEIAKEEKPKEEPKEIVKESPKEAPAHAHAHAHETPYHAHAPAPVAHTHTAHAHEAPSHAHAPAVAHTQPHAHEVSEAPAHHKKEKKEATTEKPEKAEKPEKPAKQEKKIHVPKVRHSKKAKLTLSKGKRKRAIARVIIQQGKGIIRINKVLLEATPNKYYKQLIREVIDITGPRINEVNIDALVTGGGNAGQMQAVRTAIASGLVDYFNDDSLARALEEHGGRTMIVNDTRRVEPKKYRGPKARARYQKSYR